MQAIIGNATIELVEGDICDCETDAIVNAANNHLWMGGGVAGAIKRRGGQGIEREAISKGPIAVGEAVVTKAGALPAKYVIHAAVMGQDLITDAEKIRESMHNSLVRADELGLKSIAFPALGTGVGGFPLDKAAQVMLREVTRYLQSGSNINKVVFALYGNNAVKAFEQQLAGFVK